MLFPFPSIFRFLSLFQTIYPPEGLDNDNKNTTLIRSSQVAPIVIKNCREEFQHVTDFKEPLVYAKIADNLNEHALIKVREVKGWIKRNCLFNHFTQ